MTRQRAPQSKRKTLTVQKTKPEPKAPEPRFPGQKDGVPAVVHVSREEASHLLQDAVALIPLQVPEDVYNAVIAHSEAKASGGYAALEFVKPVPDATQQKAASLGAFGPVIMVDSFDSYIEQEEFGALVLASGMSEADSELAARWDGPPHLPLVVSLAARALYERLGEDGFGTIAKALRDVTNQSLEPLLLSDIVPYAAAAGAWAAGMERYKELKYRKREQEHAHQ